MTQVRTQTFTPEGQHELPKRCFICKNLLAPSKFKMQKMTINGENGIIRSKSCRQCTSKKAVTNNSEFKFLTRMELDSVQDEIKTMREGFLRAIKVLRKDLDRCIEENRELKVMVEDSKKSCKESKQSKREEQEQ